VLVPVLAVAEPVSDTHAVLHIATLLQAVLRALVKAIRRRVDLPEVQGVEGIVEHEHLGFRAQALTPEILAADERTSLGSAMKVIDLVQAHDADDLTLSVVSDIFGQTDREDDFRPVLRQTLVPGTLVGHSERVEGGEELRDVRIIDPDDDLLEIALEHGPDVDLWALAKLDVFHKESPFWLGECATRTCAAIEKSRLFFYSRDFSNGEILIKIINQ
jgi:hypothetical protein